MWADQVRFSSTVTPRSTAWDTILIGELFKYIKGLGVLVEKELAIIIDARKLALVGKFLIKFSSLSAPTKIEELTAGSDEKNTAQPAPVVRACD